MASQEFLQNLFRAHVADLNSVIQETRNSFVCPICMVEYSEDDLVNGELTDGHIWPEYMREKSNSEIADQQRVLLCKTCNSTAGSRGDKQMQLREQVKDGEKIGQLEERRVQVIPSTGEGPITLRAKINIRESETIEGQISFPVDKKRGQWLRNNPRERARFLDVKNDKFAMLIYPPHELKSELAPVGWITSAYLLAFYTFGYRYILNPSLAIVRDYILRSFDTEASITLEIPNLDNFVIRECGAHYHRDPEIALIIPTDNKKHIHLQVSLFDYHIRLPFPFVPYVLDLMLQSVPDIAQQLPSMIGSDRYLYSPISCNKFMVHECRWDYLLGKPFPVE